jgi:hypothetical protein
MADRFEKTNLPRPQFLVREECRERSDFKLPLLCCAEHEPTNYETIKLYYLLNLRYDLSNPLF